MCFVSKLLPTLQERELLLKTEFTTNAASRESETSIMIDR